MGPSGVFDLLRHFVFAAIAVLATATAAFAHASLNAAEPQDGAIVETAPPGFSLTFSEPVSPLSLALVRPDGTQVALDRFELKDRTLQIDAPPGLGHGTHVLSWRVVSQDGHPIGGSVVFSIGEASAEPPMVEDEVDWTVRLGLWLSKVALYVGLFIGVGGVFARRFLLPGVGAGSPFIAAALVIGTAGAALSIGFQGLDALAVPVGRISEPIIWSTGYGTSYGWTVAAAIAAFFLAGLGLAARGVVRSASAILGLGMACLALTLSGHASAAAPQWLMRPMVFLHAAGIAAWIGALVPLGLALRQGVPASLPALRRFSRFIPAAVAGLILAGTVLAVVQVARPYALVETAYGQVFMVKLALLVGLFVLAAVNRWSLTASVEAGDPAAARRLVRSVVVETFIVLLIFGAAAAWRFTPPPRVLAAAAAEPATEYIHTDKALAYISVLPGRVGTVDLSVNVLTGDFEKLDAKEVSVLLSNPKAGIEPFRRQLVRRGEANWRAEGVTIPLAGLWRMRIDVLISDFEIVRLEGQVRIR